MNLFELSAKISVDDSAFKKSMENAQKVSKNVVAAVEQLQSPLDKAKSGFNAIAHPVETAKANIEKLKNATESIRHPIETFKNKVADASAALETKRNKLSTLAAGYDSAKKKVADITKEFNKSAKESGTSSQKTQELAKKLNEAEKEAEEAKKELDDYSASVSKAGKNSDSASKGVGNFASKLGKGLATAGKIGVAAVGAAAAGITALTMAAVNNYAEYEQLVGGAELMFGKAYDMVAKNAQDAYKTVQMSQSEYLQQVNGFATGLKTALGGNEQAAAELAHNIVQAEADIIAATGNTAENVQNAFNGIMKSNFTMLDNLQIGITPTKEGFQEVIDKVNEWNKANGEATNYQMGNLADMQSALVDYIDMVGMSGYAQREASETITGSISSMKAAWTNLVTGFADDSADLDKLIGNLTDSVVGYTDESGKQVKGVLDNLLPAIEKSLGGIAKLIEGAAPKIIEILPGLVERVVPSVISAATGMVDAVVKVVPYLLNTVVDAIINNAPALIDSAIVLIGELSNGILNQLPQIVQLGLDLIVSLANGIAESLPELIPTIIDVVLQIVETLTKPETLTNLLDAAIVLIENLAYGLMDAIPQLVQAAFLIIENLVTFLLNPANLAKLLKMAFDIIVGIGTGLINAIPELLKSVTRIITGIIAMFKDADWGKIGKDLVDGFKRGISNAWSSLKNWFKNLFGDLIGIAKKILGIASPSKVFKKIGGFTAEGFGAGFEDEFAHVKDDMEDALNFDDASVGINASIRKVGAGVAGGAFGGTSIGNININIDGAKYSDEQSLASAIALEIQNMTDRRAAVYA